MVNICFFLVASETLTIKVATTRYLKNDVYFWYDWHIYDLQTNTHFLFFRSLKLIMFLLLLFYLTTSKNPSSSLLQVTRSLLMPDALLFSYAPYKEYPFPPLTSRHPVNHTPVCSSSLPNPPPPPCPSSPTCRNFE